MKYYIAPLEGVTNHVFRHAHQKYFPSADKYYMPFIAPKKHHQFAKKELLELLPENNCGVTTVPQILTKSSEDFIWAMNEMTALGYEEINLNVGCPSATVVTKCKGSGMLKDLFSFEKFLDEIFNVGGNSISIKTRIGVNSADEFKDIMQIYNKYPIKELTIHPRLQQDFYKNTVNMAVFKEFLPVSVNPVCYNGDMLTRHDTLHVENSFPDLNSIMIGRGIMKNPALICEINGTDRLSKDVLRAFTDELFEEYTKLYQSQNSAMMRMKELWNAMIFSFEDHNKLIKNINKCKNAYNFTTITNDIFDNYDLLKREF